MMEVEVKLDHEKVWIDIEDDAVLRDYVIIGATFTGGWRLGGEGKPYDITHPEL